MTSGNDHGHAERPRRPFYADPATDPDLDLLYERCVDAVMRLSRGELSEILSTMSQQRRHATWDETLRRMMRTELADFECEPYGKVTRLVVLCNLVDTVRESGVEIDAENRELRDRCERRTRELLALAMQLESHLHPHPLPR